MRCALLMLALAVACGGREHGRGGGGGSTRPVAGDASGTRLGSCLVCLDSWDRVPGFRDRQTVSCGDAGGEGGEDAGAPSCRWPNGGVECAWSEGCHGLGRRCDVCSPLGGRRLARCAERPDGNALTWGGAGEAPWCDASPAYGVRGGVFGALPCVSSVDACDEQGTACGHRTAGGWQPCDDGTAWPPVELPNRDDEDQRMICTAGGWRCER